MYSRGALSLSFYPSAIYLFGVAPVLQNIADVNIEMKMEFVPPFFFPFLSEKKKEKKERMNTGFLKQDPNT